MTWQIEPMPLHGPLFEGAITVYGAAFAEPPYSDDERAGEVQRRIRDVHSRRAAFRGFVAVEAGRVLGMIYGYHGARGQWWHDTVANQLGRATATDWLSDSYELVEVAVDPGSQSRGIGAALINQLLEGRTEATSVLSTRTDSRAHVLYRRLGYEEITVMRFASAGADFYIMGKRLGIKG